MKHIRILFLIAICFLAPHIGVAQEVPTPAATQNAPIVLTDATIHLGNGNVIEKGFILFDNGKIVQCGSMDTYPTLDNLKIISCAGKHIYPGIIAPITSLGLQEIEAVRATNDVREVGVMNPNIRSAIAYNTDSRIIPTVRSNGVLIAQVVPEGGRISGTSCVMQLDAWNWEDAWISDDGVWVTFPNMYSYSGWWAEPGSYQKNKDYNTQIDELNTFLEAAKAYSMTTVPKVKNLKFEAMRDIWNGSKNLYIRAGGAKEILAAISLCETYNIKPILVGAYDAYLIADILAAKKIAVILDKCHALPARTDDDIQQNYKTPAILQKAGVVFCIGIDGSWQTRNLCFEAGTACAFGLSKEEALACITSNTAKILKLDKQLGTLEPGKNATFIVTEGDVFDMKEGVISLAFIDGRQIDLNNKQSDLYKKYARKYGILY